MIRRYKYSIILSAIILYLSLKNANELSKVPLINIPHFDKFAHFCMYFTLMTSIFYETAVNTLNKSLFTLALIPFFYGIILEILQGTLTTTRSASVYDAIFNTVGILISILVWLTIIKLRKHNFR